MNINIIVGLVIIIFSICIDQISKYLARKYLKNNDTSKKRFLSFSYAENSGGAMSKFAGNLWLLIVSLFLIALSISSLE